LRKSGKVDYKWNTAHIKTLAQKRADAEVELLADTVNKRILFNIDANFPTGGGGLRTAQHKVKTGPAKRRVFNGAIYAAIREYGGVIKPVKAKALSIPVHPRAKGKVPRDFNDLVYIPRKGKPGFLVQKRGRGKNHERMDIMFVLVAQVKQDGKPYFRPGYREGLQEFKGLIK